MYAIIETGGKQYKAEKGKTIKIEKIDKKQGEKIKFDKVLLISENGKTSIGTPYIEGREVTGEIKEEIKEEKIRVFKMKAKKRYQRTQGHRQTKSIIEIQEIT